MPPSTWGLALVLVHPPELTPLIHYYLRLYTKPNARFTVTVDTGRTPYPTLCITSKRLLHPDRILMHHRIVTVVRVSRMAAGV